MEYVSFSSRLRKYVRNLRIYVRKKHWICVKFCGVSVYFPSISPHLWPAQFPLVLWSFCVLPGLRQLDCGVATGWSVIFRAKPLYLARISARNTITERALWPSPNGRQAEADPNMNPAVLPAPAPQAVYRFVHHAAPLKGFREFYPEKVFFVQKKTFS